MKAWITKWLLGGFIRGIAEGKNGTGPKKLYWWLSGKKTATSALCGLAFAAFCAVKPALALEWAPTATFILGILVTVGLVDREWKNAPPLTQWKLWASSLLSAGPAISAVFALLVQWLPLVPGCESCAGFVPQVQWAAGAVAAGTAWLAARWNLPPTTMERRAEDLDLTKASEPSTKAAVPQPLARQ
jgi:hypothetical protein